MSWLTNWLARSWLGDYGDLYRLTVDQLTNLEWLMDWGEEQPQKIIAGIEKTKTYGLAWLLRAMSVGRIRERQASALARHFGSADALYCSRSW